MFYQFKCKPIFVLAIAFFLFSCKDAKKAQEPECAAQSQSSVVQTGLVREGIMSDELLLNGDICCDESHMVKIFPPVSGKITSVTHQVGDYVRRGEVLGIIHSEEAADYSKGIQEAEAEYNIARRDWRMKTDMLASGMASQKDVEEAHSRLMVAEAERQRLHQVAGISGFSRHADAVVRSPLSGYITAQSVYDQSYVDTGSDNPAYTIANLSQVWVLADVYENDISKVRMGQPVTVTVSAYPDQVFYGQINKIYSVLDPDAKTMKVRVTLNNAKGLLKPGMFATVHVALRRSGGSMLCVPSDAVVFENGHHYVVVVKGTKHYECREISVAHDDGKHAFLSGGVKEGERVVTANALLVFNALEDAQ